MQLKIEDVLIEPVTVHGIRFDTKATVWLTEHREKIQVHDTDIDFDNLKLIIETDSIHELPIDWHRLSKKWYVDIIEAIEAEAIRQAEVSDKWQPDDEE